MTNEFFDLLERTGAKVHGRRADCPSCKRRRSVSLDLTKGAFCCHGADCDFRGGTATLRRRLGLRRQWLPRSEYVRQRRCERLAIEKAFLRYEANRTRRLELLYALNQINRLEVRAHEAGFGHPACMAARALCYAQRPEIEAELDALERDLVENQDEYYCP